MGTCNSGITGVLHYGILWRWSQHVSPKRWCLPTSSQSVTTQNININLDRHHHYTFTLRTKYEEITGNGSFNFTFFSAHWIPFEKATFPPSKARCIWVYTTPLQVHSCTWWLCGKSSKLSAHFLNIFLEYLESNICWNLRIAGVTWRVILTKVKQ